MKSVVALSAALAIVANATPVPYKPKSIKARELPQEHSHEQFLTTVTASLQEDNPLNLGDPVLALLGDAV